VPLSDVLREVSSAVAREEAVLEHNSVPLTAVGAPSGVVASAA
jgi:hypothetical protein